MKKSTLRRADLIFSLVLMVISVLTMIESYSLMKNPFKRADISPEEISRNMANWYESIGIVPFILAIFILICAIALFRFAWREGARFDFFSVEKAKALVQNREFQVAVTVSAILIVYIGVLIPCCRKTLDFFPRFQGFPFMIATFFMLFLMMVAFEKRSVKHTVMSLVVSSLAAALIAYGFGVVAMIPLP